jgi:hypothetical protein
MTIRATALTTGVNRAPEVLRINYEDGLLSISMTVEEDSATLVSFASVVGFRVLDEGDLLEFWPTCSSPIGWLWEIHDGGWFDLESKRPQFIRDKYKSVTEYLVLGDNECVSVLSHDRPHIKENAL